jgi:amino acid transporter
VLGSWAWVVLLAIVISAASSTQTTILPTARGTLAMAAYKALPRRFSTVHPVYKTPSFSTLVMGVVAIVYYVGLTIISDNILADSILSLGLAIAFYYAVVAFSCVRYFRRQIFTSARNFLVLGLLPLLGGLMLTAAFIKSAIDMTDPEYGYTVLFGVGGAFVLGIGVLLLGVVLMIAWYATQESKPFFNGETLNDETPVLVPDES